MTMGQTADICIILWILYGEVVQRTTRAGAVVQYRMQRKTKLCWNLRDMNATVMLYKSTNKRFSTNQ